MIASGRVPRAMLDGAVVEAGELSSLSAAVTFDVTRRRAAVEASVELSGRTEGAFAAFDLRQPVASARLDGWALDAAELRHVDLGGSGPAGRPGAAMRVLRRPLGARRVHRLELEYEWGVPDVEDPKPVRWDTGSVAWDVWCSDLYPGRYLEQWLPVSLCQDVFDLRLEITVVGAAAAHAVIHNAGAEVRDGDHHWRLEWDRITPLSCLLVLGEEAHLARASAEGFGARVDAVVEIDAGTGGPNGARADDLAERALGWLEANARRLGPYDHGERFLAHVWGSPRGMEYDGAASASVAALEHEVFHAWFGRGVKPATASDGWIDEAITTWCTADEEESAGGRPARLSAAAFPLDEPPVVLAPASPWSRHTPREAYPVGARLFADLAGRAGGADAVLDALAGVYGRHAGGFLSTDELERELRDALGVDPAPWWDRYVRGAIPRSGAS